MNYGIVYTAWGLDGSANRKWGLFTKHSLPGSWVLVAGKKSHETTSATNRVLHFSEEGFRYDFRYDSREIVEEEVQVDRYGGYCGNTYYLDPDGDSDKIDYGFSYSGMKIGNSNYAHPPNTGPFLVGSTSELPHLEGGNIFYLTNKGDKLSLVEITDTQRDFHAAFVPGSNQVSFIRFNDENGNGGADELHTDRRQWEKRMSIKCSVYIAASVDGFIARPDGDIEWLHKSEYASPDKLSLSYDEFIATVDVLVMGRKSFEKVLSFSSWPYENVPLIVLSSLEVEIPDDLRGKVKVDSGDPIDIVSRLESAGNRHLYIDGGATIQRFLQAGLINEITVTQIPVLLGAGIPLFGSINVEITLKHIETASSSNGFVQSRYQVLASPNISPDATGDAGSYTSE